VSSAETSPSLAAIVASVDTTLPSFRDRTSPDGMMPVRVGIHIGNIYRADQYSVERVYSLIW
jgi:hypothetical protein